MVGKLLHGIASSVAGGIVQGFAGVRKTLVDSFGMVVSYHNESMKFARSAGMSLQQAHAYTKVLTTRAAELGQKYGLAASEVQNLERNLQNAVSRQLMLSDDQAEKMVQINRLVGEGVSSAYSEQMVTRMGAQIDTVQGAIAKAYGTAMKSGLNAEKMTQKISQNLSMANRLSFRNGIDGLTRMAMLSEKMGMNMQSVESAAGNFMELDKAIENAAHLQMLGGSAAAMFGNPLTAAYEANYDPEAFAKRMSDSLASYATFDASKGISSINGMNMDFVRNIAKAMGISTEEAASMAKKQAEVRYKENTFGTTLDRMSGGDEMKRDMLINKSTIQNGQLGMVSMKDNKFHEMSYYQSGEGKKEMDEMMAMYGKSDSEIMMEIASTEKTINEQIQGFFTSISGTIGKLFVESGIMPKIQNFIDEKGAMLVQKVSDGVDWILNGGLTKWWGDKWQWLQNVWDTTKKWGAGIAAVLGVIAAWKIGKGALSITRGARAGITRGGGRLGRAVKSVLNTGKNANIGKGLTYMKNQFTGSRAAGKGIFKSIGAMFTTHKNTAGKLVGRTGNGAGWGFVSKAGVSGMKLLRGATGVGLAGMAGNYFADKGIFGKEGSAGSQIVKAGSTALEYGALGATIGSIIPGVGTIIGGAVGALGGAVKGWYDSQAKQYKGFGDFANSKFSAMKNAVSSVAGSIADGAKSAAKWVNDGVGKVIKWFGFKTNEGEAKPKKYATGGIVTGGTPGRDSVRALLTPGERVLTNSQYQELLRPRTPLGKASIAALEWVRSKIMGAANNPTAIVKPKPTGGREYIYNPGGTSTSTVNGNKITVKDFNVNISGTIKIDAGRNFTNIDASTLLRDQAFVNQLKNVIKDSINNDMNGGRFMNDPATRRGQVSSTSVVGKL